MVVGLSTEKKHMVTVPELQFSNFGCQVKKGFNTMAVAFPYGEVLGRLGFAVLGKEGPHFRFTNYLHNDSMPLRKVLFPDRAPLLCI